METQGWTSRMCFYNSIFRLRSRSVVVGKVPRYFQNIDVRSIFDVMLLLSILNISNIDVNVDVLLDGSSMYI